MPFVPEEDTSHTYLLISTCRGEKKNSEPTVLRTHHAQKKKGGDE